MLLIAELELLPGSGSGSAPLMCAVLVIGPDTFRATVPVTSMVAVTSAGCAFVTCTLVASDGPRLVTVSAYVC
jgi:hypothetical protein